MKKGRLKQRMDVKCDQVYGLCDKVLMNFMCDLIDLIWTMEWFFLNIL